MKRNLLIRRSLGRRLKGNTLVEVMMSLSLLALVFMLGMYQFHQIIGIQSPAQRFRTHAAVQHALDKALPDLGSNTEEEMVFGRRIQRDWQSIGRDNQLLQIRVRCYRGDKLLEERFRIIYDPSTLKR
ncbi:MAG: hypothetical protein AAFN10_08765 [Bacteroidota bacterium]